MNPITLHRAPWIFPISGPALPDGAVATLGDRIKDAGPFPELEKKYPGSHIQDYTSCVLTPPLVNAHIHLELSHISIPQDDEPIKGFTDWIGRLLAAREQAGAVGDNVLQAARETLQRQYAEGVIGIGDIGNTNIGRESANEFPGTLLHFYEFLGRSAKSIKSISDKVSAAPDAQLFTAHAPYSTHAEIIQILKHRAKRLTHPFPIHTAEPPAENSLLLSASGELYDFLIERKFIDHSFQPPAGIDKQGSVHYLHDLGVLDDKTICIHCIHVTDDEIRMLKDTGTKVCLCPGSNRNLRVGRAPAEKMLQTGILPALGTDSKASNPELSIWREMRILKEENTDVPPEAVLAMATLGGAKALGLDSEYGTLAKGKKAKFLAVKIPGDTQTAQDALLYLTSAGQAIQPSWIEEK